MSPTSYQAALPRDMVPEAGIEPVRDCSHGILSPGRLPIPPFRHSFRLRCLPIIAPPGLFVNPFGKFSLGFGFLYYSIDFSSFLCYNEGKFFSPGARTARSRMHHTVKYVPFASYGIFRPWRKHPPPAACKQACRPSGGVREADSANAEPHRPSCVNMMQLRASYG